MEPWCFCPTWAPLVVRPRPLPYYGSLQLAAPSGSHSSMPSLLLPIKDLEEHHSSFFLLYPLFAFSQWSWEDKLSNEVLGAEVEEAQMYKQEVEEGDPQMGGLVTDAVTGRIRSQL